MRTKGLVYVVVVGFWLTSGFTGTVFGWWEGPPNAYFGVNAGFSNSGSFNTFIGVDAGYSNYGDSNSFLGYFAGYSNTGGTNNSFLGSGAGYSNTIGHDNTFLGGDAGYKNTEGVFNTFIGADAGYKNTIGTCNNFVGFEAGYSNITGYNNSFIGMLAGNSNTIGHDNSFLGHEAGRLNIMGDKNTFLGAQAGYSNNIGNYNSFLGAQAGYSNTEGYSNTFIGYLAGNNNTGSLNTFIGVTAGYHNTTGYNNVFIGPGAGYANTEGYYNTFIGNSAGGVNATGSGNVFLGFEAGFNETGSNKLYIANSTTSSPLIYGEFDTEIVSINGKLGIGTKTPTSPLSIVSPSAGNLFTIATTSSTGGAGFQFSVPTGGLWNFKATMDNGFKIRDAANGKDVVYVQYATGHVGIGTDNPGYLLDVAGPIRVQNTVYSSSRTLKDNITDLKSSEALEALKAFNPVKFTYKTDPATAHIGFIAEDVPNLVAQKNRDAIDPMDIVAVLTKVVQEQQGLIKKLEQRLLALECKGE